MLVMNAGYETYGPGQADAWDIEGLSRTVVESKQLAVAGT